MNNMDLGIIIDKSRIRQAFSRQAPIYEENASLQKDVATRLISLIPKLRTPPSALRTLDIGIGTGFASKAFSSRFPDAGMFGCDIARGMLKEAEKTGSVLAEADAEHLPYKNDNFDVLFSSLALQWTNLSNSLTETYRVLKPEGLFYFATFGEHTLKELADSYDSAWSLLGMDGTGKTMKFEPSQKIKSLVASTGFIDPEIKTEVINCRYGSPELLLRSLKAIGAGNPSRDFHPSRTLLQKTFQIYNEKYGDDKGIPATFEIVYAWGRK